jgi:CheY-like chemotaxis protein
VETVVTERTPETQEVVEEEARGHTTLVVTVPPETPQREAVEEVETVPSMALLVTAHRVPQPEVEEGREVTHQSVEPEHQAHTEVEVAEEVTTPLPVVMVQTSVLEAVEARTEVAQVVLANAPLPTPSQQEEVVAKKNHPKTNTKSSSRTYQRSG